LVVGNNGFDLGLLQHDFRYPHGVGRLIELPGQIFAPMVGKPGENSLRKG